MHPDSATDAIVDLAIAHGKPFVICPCCVFPNTFTDRRIPKKLLAHEEEELVPVRSYDDLCAYILGRAEGVHEAVLDFEGRNRCFYWIPP